MKIFLPVLLAVILVGCVTKLTPEQEAAVDWGAYPTNYEQITTNYFSRTLIDPESARYEIAAPFKGYSHKAPITGGKPKNFGYVVDVHVNAKNRMGGYTGSQHYQLIIKDGTVIQFDPIFP